MDDFLKGTIFEECENRLKRRISRLEYEVDKVPWLRPSRKKVLLDVLAKYKVGLNVLDCELDACYCGYMLRSYNPAIVWHRDFVNFMISLVPNRNWEKNSPH